MNVQTKRTLRKFACVSPYIFAAATLIIGYVTPGYNQMTMTVSRLSIGAFGLVQTLNLFVFALGMLSAAEFLAPNARVQPTRSLLRIVFQFTAATIALIAVFPTDPIDTFPKQIFTISWSAAVHFILVGSYILITPIAIWSLAKRFRQDADFTDLVTFTAATGFLAFFLSVIWFWCFYYGVLNEYRGLFQKAIILDVFVWLIGIMNRLAGMDGGYRPSSS